jgi:thiosulfate/3-mercaptopyruvate sulfurtransferase
MDLRKVEDYKAGHIPGAVNVIGASIYVKKGELNNEVPMMDDLSDVLTAAGVTADSQIVVVETDGSRFAWATRAAWTLKYAGLENVALLDGGYAAWTKAGKAVQTEVVTKKGDFTAYPQEAYFASKDYLLAASGAQIIDARTYDSYFGLTRQAFVAQAGHYKGALALPYTWITRADGTIKTKAELQGYVDKLFLDPSAETIVYCDSGVLATTWWWVFSEVLGWKDVRNFDGSSQVLAADPNVSYVTIAWR